MVQSCVQSYKIDTHQYGGIRLNKDRLQKNGSYVTSLMQRISAFGAFAWAFHNDIAVSQQLSNLLTFFHVQGLIVLI